MSRSCLIGYSGFVGSNLLRQRPFDDLYRSTNIADIRGQDYDLVVCAGVSAAKWKANAQPAEDLETINLLVDHLRRVKSERFVLISTVDVYPVVTAVDEDFDCSGKANHAYGANRLHLELALRSFMPDMQIIRLPGLFGPGLKKNVIYDFLHDNCLEMINPNGVYQYYDLLQIGADLETILSAGVPLINLATEPVATAEIHRRFFPQSAVGSASMPGASYDIRTRYGRLFGQPGYYRASTDQVLQQLQSFIAAKREQTTK